MKKHEIRHEEITQILPTGGWWLWACQIDVDGDALVDDSLRNFLNECEAQATHDPPVSVQESLRRVCDKYSGRFTEHKLVGFERIRDRSPLQDMPMQGFPVDAVDYAGKEEAIEEFCATDANPAARRITCTGTATSRPPGEEE